MLPRFTSIQTPEAALMQQLQSLVQHVRQNIGPVPIYTKTLQAHPEKYLPWMHQVLVDLSAAQVHLLAEEQRLHQQMQDTA